MGAENLYEQLKGLERDLKVPLIKPELEVILILYKLGPLSSRQLENNVRCSPSGFSNLKKRLLDGGILISKRSNTDKRSILFDISESVRVSIKKIHSGYVLPDVATDISQTIFSNFLGDPDGREPSIPILGEQMKSSVRS